MTTQKQAAANQANAQKSTGPKTAAGKATVGQNAIRHGILSTRLFLEGEDPAEFVTLQDELRQTLLPVGVLELALVEKIAVALWKQRRLVAAETAFLERSRSLSCPENCHAISEAMGLSFPYQPVTPEEAEPMSQEELEQLEWCHAALAEFGELDTAILTNNDLDALAEYAPYIYGQFECEADDEALTPEAFLASLPEGLSAWAEELRQWCRHEIARWGRRPLVQLIARWMVAEKSAPIGNELLTRYQIALDGELYRAMHALRDQQAWRKKSEQKTQGRTLGGQNGFVS